MTAALLRDGFFRLVGQTPGVRGFVPVARAAAVDCLLITPAGLEGLQPGHALMLVHALLPRVRVAFVLDRLHLAGFASEVDEAVGTASGPATRFLWPDQRRLLWGWLKGEPAAAQHGAAEPRPTAADAGLVALLGSKGGVGTTWLAVNLAVALAQRFPGEVALLDLSLRNADAALHLDLLGGPTMIDFLPRLGDWESASRCWRQPPFVALHVLPGTPRPDLAELITTEAVEQLLHGCRSRYRWTVCDLGVADGSELARAAVCQAVGAAVVTALEGISLRRARSALDWLDALGWREKGWPVANQVDPDGTVAYSEAEAFLGRPLVAGFASDRVAVESSILMAQPLAAQPGHPLAAAFQAWVAALIGEMPPSVEQSGRKAAWLPLWARGGA